jgi:hypothetical protein
MLVATFFAVAQQQTNTATVSQPESMNQIIMDDDVPIWEIGDTWTYRIDDIDVDFQEENQTVQVHLEIDQLLLEVTGDNPETYDLEFSGEISGTCNVDVDFGEGPILLDITLESTPISGDLVIEKSNLGIDALNAYIQGTLIVHVFEQPYFNLPFSIPQIPIKGEVDLNVDVGTPLAILEFPMSTLTAWNLTATNFTLDGELRSIWLRIIDFINTIVSIFGIELIPPEMAALLPDVDLSDTFDILGVGSFFEIPEIPYAFTCFERDNITVEAGTFDAYNISIAGGVAGCYYAPDAGNVIKIEGNFQELLPYITDISMELVATTYS